MSDEKIKEIIDKYQKKFKIKKTILTKFIFDIGDFSLQYDFCKN